MDTSKLTNAVKTIRRELLIKDEPLKAYYLLKELNLPELKDLTDLTYSMVRHAFEPDYYDKAYVDDPVENCELIESKEVILHAEKRYARYAWIIQEVDALKPKTFLDLGCYIGSLVATTASRDFVTKAYGCDMTKQSIAMAKQRAKEVGLEHKTKYWQGDATKFDKVKADMVVAFEIIEHVVDPEQFVKHLMNLSTGWVYVSTPDGPYGNGEGNLGHWEGDGIHTRGHLRVFTKATMFEMLEKCGAEIAYLEGMPDGLLWVKFRRK